MGVPRVSLPVAFCWSKIGTEAGEGVDSILERKEAERRRGGGTFLWGIGNSIGPSVASLLEVDSRPTVLFSPMRSAAAPRDIQPDVVVTWQSALAFDGGTFDMPAGATVTSSLGTRRRHYALVCHRDESLLEYDSGLWIDDRRLRNLRTGTPVGSSQVTSVVCTIDTPDDPEPRYGVAFRAHLQAPYLLVLEDPLTLRDVSDAGSGLRPMPTQPYQRRLAV